MKKAIIALFISVSAIICSGCSPAKNLPGEYVRMNAGVTGDMTNPDYWIRKSTGAEKILMNAEEIKEWNINCGNVVSVSEYSENIWDLDDEVDGGFVRALISCHGIPEAGSGYINGEPITQEFIDSIAENRNIGGINDKVNAGYGYSVSRQSLRSLPSEVFAGEDPDDYFYDILVTSEFMPFMPLRILHTSADNNWYYVMFYGYAGWVQKQYVAVCENREDWLKRQECENFLVVTGREIRLPDDVGCKAVSGLILPMGTKMELVKYDDAPENIRGRVSYANFIVKIPTVDKNGNIKDEYALIPVSDDVNFGHLDYTHANVVRLSLKLLGDRYGWAGLNHSNDCSGVVHEIFACFGFQFPRGATDQANIKGMTTFTFDENTTEEERLEVLKNAPIGSLVRFPGHIMIYLGTVKGEPYVISSLGSFVAESGGEIISSNTMMINSVIQTYRGNGKNWLNNFTHIIYCEPEK